jgi:hypothetical protein
LVGSRTYSRGAGIRPTEQKHPIWSRLTSGMIFSEFVQYEPRSDISERLLTTVRTFEPALFVSAS